MKKILLCVLVLTWTTASLQAQTNRKKTTAKKTTTTRTVSRSTRAQTPVISAVSTGSYAARSRERAGVNHLTISDPTINALNARANGSDVQVSKSGIVGMPKRAYGFANGRLVLNSSGATSSGTITGSGAVGTGSSLGSIGSNGPAIGLNGKSPYAGSSMWGNAQRLTLNYGDSGVRRPRGKKQ
jgi:hypothetical protein